MDDPAKPKITFNHFNHPTLTTFLDARNLKKLKNNLKSLGIKNKQLNHYLLTTYRIINDLESAQAEHRRRPKHVRATGKEYVNTVEFVRLVADIVAGHILNAVCGGHEDSPKVDNDLAKRLLNEFSSQIGTADEGTSEHHTHGDHIRLGVANAVAEMLTTAKKTGGLPGVEYTAKKTALSTKAEAERRRRGALAARWLAAGKLNYDYCDSRKLNPRMQASRNKKFPKFDWRKLNHRRTDAAKMDDRQTSSDGVKSGANFKAATKVPGRPKLDLSLPVEKDRGTTSTQNVARKVQLEKTIDSQIGQKRPANVIKNSDASKVNVQKTVGESHSPSKSKNINATVKLRDPIPRRPMISDNTVINMRPRQQRDAVRGKVTVRLHKDVSPHKQAAADKSKTGVLIRIVTRKSKSKSADPTSNTVNGRVRGTAIKEEQKKITDPMPTRTTEKIWKSGPTGMLPKEVKTSGPRRKLTLADVEGSDKKHKNSLNNKRTILSESGVEDKSISPGTKNGNAAEEKLKTSRTKNGGAIVKKSKILGTRSGGVAVEKSKITMTINDGAVEEKLKLPRTRNVVATVVKPKTSRAKNSSAVVEKSKIAVTINGGATILENPTRVSRARNDNADTEKSKNTRTENGVRKSVQDGDRDITAAPSETLILPAIDYHDDASLTAAHDGINEPIETKKTVAETVGGSPIPADIQDDGVKNTLNWETKKDSDFDERDPVKTNGDLVETKRDQIENRMNKPKTVGYNSETGADDAEIEADDAETGADNAEIGQDNVETGHKTTKSMVEDGTGNHRSMDICNDDRDSNVYKLRMSCVLGVSDQCQNQHTGLYQAKRICSKYEVTDLTKEEYCKIKNTSNKQIKK